MKPARTLALALDISELQHWLGLSQLKAAHRRTAVSALREYGTPTAVFDAFATSFPNLCARFGKSFAQSILALPHAALQHAAECALAWQAADPISRHIVALADPGYPDRLLQAADPPLLLFVHGRLDLLVRPSIAVVGSRKPSQQGQENAYAFSRALTQAGWTIVSGLAQGIDARAHQAALDEAKASAAEAKGAGAIDAEAVDAAAGASTIAVIGTGIDVVYPWQHRSLSGAISGAGAIVSEWPLGTPARAAHFPQRNRLIAALSHGVLVVEATLRSGSLITARIANDIGRDVFAIPGSIHAPQSRGCHALIKEGAKLVDSVDDILGELTQTELPKSPSRTIESRPRAVRCEKPCPTEGNETEAWNDKQRATAARKPRGAVAKPSQPASPGDNTARQVLDLLGHDPATADTLAERGDWDAATVIGALTRLEIGGWVEQQAGRYVRTAR